MDRMFSGKDLRRLIAPLMVEQALAMMIGMADTVMVASCSEAAVSGISLVDSINAVFLWLFPALATGGGVVLAQYLGAEDTENARRATGQLVLLLVGFSLLVTTVFFAFQGGILRLLFGAIEPAVMENAKTYFIVSILSYPFLALYNVGAAVYRAMGNSRVSMMTSVAMNVLNIAGNALLIFGFGMGVLGAGIASLAARVLGAVIMLVLLCRPECRVGLQRWRDLAPEGRMFRRILNIGIPSGLESAAFNIGKLLVSSLVSTLPTTSITANAVMNSLQGIILIPTAAIHLAAVPIVGQCLGAGRQQDATYYSKWLLKLAYLCLFITAGGTLLFSSPIIGLFRLTPETATLVHRLILYYFFISITLYPLSFTLTPCIRAAGDARYCMVGAMVGMWLGRIACSYLFVGLGLGLMGIWYAILADWIIRIAFFLPRFASGRWLRHRVI